MAYVIIENNIVVGLFAVPQNHLDLYEEIADDDVRINDFYQTINGGE